MIPLVRLDTLANKFITMDIDTFIKDGVHIPYTISWYDGENIYSYYLTDYKSSEDMIINALRDLMIKNMIIIKYIFIIYQVSMEYFYWKY